MRGDHNDRLVIAHVCGYYGEGLGYQENKLPFAQSALGHDVHIVTGDRYFPHPRYDEVYGAQLGPRHVGAGTRVEDGVTVHRLPITVEIARRQNPLLPSLVRTLRRLSPDVIHLHGVTPLTSLTVLASDLWRSSKIVVDHHLCAFNMEPASAARKVYYWAFRRLILPRLRHRVAAWLPINEDAARVLDRWLGIRDGRVRISRLGADTDGLKHDPGAGAQWREKAAVPQDAKLVVHCGKVEPRKETHRLIECVRDSGEADIVLVIAGDGDAAYRRSLEELAGTDSRIRFLPQIPHDELCAFFNAADLAVWPGDPAITLIEAIACGTPVLMAHPPGLDYVGHCPYVATFRRGEMRALADAVARSLADAGTDAEECDERCAFVARNLSWAAIARQTIEIYTGRNAPVAE